MCSIVFLHTLGSLGSLHSQRNILGISQNLCKLSLKAGPKLEVNKTEVDKKFVDIESAIHQKQQNKANLISSFEVLHSALLPLEFFGRIFAWPFRKDDFSLFVSHPSCG